MMPSEVWVVWPTVHCCKSQEMARLWHTLEYRVAILVEEPLGEEAKTIGADLLMVEPRWEGFPYAANLLCHQVPGDVVVVVGDDISPHEGKLAGEIAAEFRERFPNLLGVMQPTGDVSYPPESAVSPWIGRRFIEEVYGGKGPYWEGYFHLFCDAELQGVAERMGAFQRRPDLLQYHDHWTRRKNGGGGRPEHLNRAKQAKPHDRALYAVRRAAGFPDG